MAKSGAKKNKTETQEHRGEVLDVVRALLAEGKTSDVLGVVSQLVAKNGEEAFAHRRFEVFVAEHFDRRLGAGERCPALLDEPEEQAVARRRPRDKDGPDAA